MRQLVPQELLSTSAGIQLLEVIPFLSGYNNLSLVNSVFFQVISGAILGGLYGFQWGFNAMESLSLSLKVSVLCAAWAIPEYYIGSLCYKFIDNYRTPFIENK